MIRLTCYNGQDLYIAPEHVVAVMRHHKEPWTLVWTGGGNDDNFVVKDSVDRVVDIIEGAKERCQ